MSSTGDVPSLDVLVVAPHPDDAELGAGGTICKLQEEGLQVGVVDLTDGEPTPHGSPEIRAAETRMATELLGLAWRGNLGLPNRELEATLEARRQLAIVIRLSSPRWILAPYWQDAHPDHIAATEIAEAARFWAKLTKTDMPGDPWHPERIFHYFCVHLKLAVHPSFIVDISDQWPRKLAAIEAYQSQFVTNRPTDSPTLLEQFHLDAAYWGKLIGRRFGEPFAAREPVGIDSLQGLI
jgi:bacillithiol biosynthesis deacetylase BshB1